MKPELVNLIVLIVLAAGGAAAWFFLQKRKEKQKEEEAKPATFPQPALVPSNAAAGSTLAPSAGTVVKPFEELSEAEWNAWRNSFAASTRSFIPEHGQRAYRDGLVRDAALQPAVDRSGFALTAQNGYMVNPRVVMGQPYVFTMPVDPALKTVQVFPIEGEQLTKVNGQTVIYFAKLAAPADGNLVLSVEGVGREAGAMRIRVHLVP